jgi:hypothetical protein
MNYVDASVATKLPCGSQAEMVFLALVRYHCKKVQCEEVPQSFLMDSIYMGFRPNPLWTFVDEAENASNRVLGGWASCASRSGSGCGGQAVLIRLNSSYHEDGSLALPQVNIIYIGNIARNLSLLTSILPTLIHHIDD